MKTIGLEKVELFPKQVVAGIAARHLSKFVNRIFKEGRDKDGKTMREYTEKYAELKSQGFKKLKQTRGGKKRAGTQYSSFGKQGLNRQIHPPNLQLTTKTRQNTKIKGDKISSDGYALGWDNEPATILQYQAEEGRDVIDSIPQDELDWVRDQFHKNIDKQLRTKVKSHLRIVAGRK